MKWLAVALLMCPYCVRSAVVSAEESVRSALAKAGVRAGVDAANKRYVFVASATRTIKDPANDKGFMQIRDHLAKIAELTARMDLIKARCMNIDMNEAVLDQSREASSLRATEANYKLFAEAELQGSSVLASAESWDADTAAYQVAVAVAWSPKAELSLAAMANRTDGASDEDVEYEKWVRSVDLLHVIGSRRFKDSQGNWRLVGVGVADVEGLQSTARRLAMRKAELRAKANLAFAINCSAACREVAKMKMVEAEENGSSGTDAWESYVYAVERKSGSRPVKAHEVHAACLTHPITGREVYVSVCGAEGCAAFAQ